MQPALFPPSEPMDAVIHADKQPSFSASRAASQGLRTAQAGACHPSPDTNSSAVLQLCYGEHRLGRVLEAFHLARLA